MSSFKLGTYRTIKRYQQKSDLIKDHRGGVYAFFGEFFLFTFFQRSESGVLVLLVFIFNYVISPRPKTWKKITKSLARLVVYWLQHMLQLYIRLPFYRGFLFSQQFYSCFTLSLRLLGDSWWVTLSGAAIKINYVRGSPSICGDSVLNLENEPIF